MKLDNSNLFETLSQIRSGQYSAMYAAAAKKESPSVTDPADKPVDSGTGQVCDGKTLTFDTMSRKQLSDLHSGKTESSGDEAKSDTTAINFMEKAQDAIKSAAQRNDKSSVQFWANAMATMNQFQGKAA